MTYSTNPNSSIDCVKVFGSAVVRVAPDTASVTVAVSRTEQEPDAAFAHARGGNAVSR